MAPFLESDIFHNHDMDRQSHNTGESNPADVLKALRVAHELLNKLLAKSTLSEQPPTTEKANITAPSPPGETWSPYGYKIVNNTLPSQTPFEEYRNYPRATSHPSVIGPLTTTNAATNQATIPLTNGAERAQAPEPESADAHQATNTTGSEASETRDPNGTTLTNGSGSSPTPNPGPGANRLRELADEISRNVDVLQASAGTTSGPSAAGKAQDVARLKLQSALHDLQVAVRPPQETIMNWFAQVSVVSVVHVFQHWRLFDAIPAEKGSSISYAELAEKVGAEESLLMRMSWMITSSNILRYIPPPPSSPTTPARVAHTPNSLALREASPLASMFKLMYTNVVETSTILPNYFDTYGRTEPLGPGHIPTSFLAGKPDLQYFDLINEDPDRLKSFMHAMSITHKRSPILGMYDLSAVLEEAAELEDTDKRPVWVDVGGSNGNVVKVFREANPALRAEWCVVQDLPEVLEAAKEDAKGDEALEGVRWVGMDFHREAPVKDALVYYLRHIIRDYSDPVATKILSNIRQSMVPPSSTSSTSPAPSRILISEQLMTAPPPLYAAFKDYSMLAIGGKERTIAQFEALAEAAGLKVTGVYKHDGTPHAVVEMQVRV